MSAASRPLQEVDRWGRRRPSPQHRPWTKVGQPELGLAGKKVGVAIGHLSLRRWHRRSRHRPRLTAGRPTPSTLQGGLRKDFFCLRAFSDRIDHQIGPGEINYQRARSP
jgi:hypothetical protein